MGPPHHINNIDNVATENQIFYNFVIDHPYTLHILRSKYLLYQEVIEKLTIGIVTIKKKMDERKHFWEMIDNHFQNSWSKDELRMCYSLYKNFTLLMSLEILWYLNLCKTKGHFLVSIIYHKEVHNTGLPMTGPWSRKSPYYIILVWYQKLGGYPPIKKWIVSPKSIHKICTDHAK